MNDLQRALENAQLDGWDGLKESEDYFKGLTREEISMLFGEGKCLGSIFVSADLVPDSTTSRRIVESGGNLKNRYVIYDAFRRGCGHDDTYG